MMFLTVLKEVNFWKNPKNVRAQKALHPESECILLFYQLYGFNSPYKKVSFSEKILRISEFGKILPLKFFVFWGHMTYRNRVWKFKKMKNAQKWRFQKPALFEKLVIYLITSFLRTLKKKFCPDFRHLAEKICYPGRCWNYLVLCQRWLWTTMVSKYL